MQPVEGLRERPCGHDGDVGAVVEGVQGGPEGLGGDGGRGEDLGGHILCHDSCSAGFERAWVLGETTFSLFRLVFG